MSHETQSNINKISAIVFLAEGSECRCLQVPRQGSVQDVIEAMVALQEEWEEIGRDGPKQLYVNAANLTRGVIALFQPVRCLDHIHVSIIVRRQRSQQHG